MLSRKQAVCQCMWACNQRTRSSFRDWYNSCTWDSSQSWHWPWLGIQTKEKIGKVCQRLQKRCQGQDLHRYEGQENNGRRWEIVRLFFHCSCVHVQSMLGNLSIQVSIDLELLLVLMLLEMIIQKRLFRCFSSSLIEKYPDPFIHTDLSIGKNPGALAAVKTLKCFSNKTNRFA